MLGMINDYTVWKFMHDVTYIEVIARRVEYATVFSHKISIFADTCRYMYDENNQDKKST